MNGLMFCAIEDLLDGRNIEASVQRELVLRGLARMIRGLLVVTDYGYAKWREFRLVPGFITLNQAILLEGLWGQVTALQLGTIQHPGSQVVGGRVLLDEKLAQAIWGQEAFAAYQLYS